MDLVLLIHYYRKGSGKLINKAINEYKMHGFEVSNESANFLPL